VLLVEDDEDDFLLTRDLLSEFTGQAIDLDWVSKYDDARSILGQDRHDVYLFDYRLGSHTGLELLSQAVTAGCKGPVILLTGEREREIDLEAMRSGAADFLVKGQFDAALLERSIRYAIEQKRDRDALRQLQADLEKRVRERTLALEQANETLRAEIEHRKRAEEALKEADRRKDEFLAMLSHELRNPLAPMSNALHIVRLRDGALDSNVRQSWEIMERQVEHLVRLVDDLLDVSRITRGKIKLQTEPVEVATIVGRAVESSRPIIESRGHILEVNVPRERMRVEGDPTRLAQILWNLLNNSAKYTPEGGRIWLTVEEVNREAVIRVKDTGLGIPASVLPRIFDLFTQAERTLDRSEGGLGIGLTLVRRLTQLHGGRVEAFSDGPGRGSEFVVRLPLLAREPASGEAVGEPAKEPQAQSRSHRIVVVDDNRDSAESLARLLRLIGHEVRTAYNGEEGLETVRAYRPDLVLLDIGLPVLDGYEVAKRIRAEPELEGIVLVALTGYGGDEDRRQAQACGFNSHMVKPLDFDALQMLLETLMPSAES
jgi:signal transduction histidine kinase